MVPLSRTQDDIVTPVKVRRKLMPRRALRQGRRLVGSSSPDIYGQITARLRERDLGP
jgi:hypothetical protein